MSSRHSWSVDCNNERKGEPKFESLTHALILFPTDPLPHLYDHAMYGGAALLGLAAAGNFLIRPVSSKFHMPPDPPSSAAAAAHDKSH